ncbi:hypothetical protein [Aeromicrobium sp.]|uniref:hypothetical protein n=1 Tax=Aeromicrobium sp. TaxID=1871063 RepID=UPI002FCAAC0A
MPSPESEPELTEKEVARRRRAAELLGDLIPDTTSDDTDEGWGERAAPTSDEEYLRDVPPHHG